MEAKARKLIIKSITLIFVIPLILTILLLKRSLISMILFLYPFIFLCLITRVILEYFDKEFYGDYLFLITLWSAYMYGVIVALVVLISTYLLSYGFNKLLKPIVILKFLSTTFFVVVILFAVNMGYALVSRSLYYTLTYYVIFIVGGLIFKFEKRDFLIEFISNGLLLLFGLFFLPLMYMFA